MNEGRIVFAQLMDELPKYEFDQCVRRDGGNRRVRSLPTYEQFLVMAFAQLTYRESLRDLTTCLGAVGSKLYHSGIRQTVARSTLADANEKRDWRIFADFAHVLIEQASALYADEPFGVELKQAAYALDSTTIDLCLSLLLAALQFGLLRNAGQAELPLPAPLLTPGGQSHGPALRSDRHPDRLLCPARLSRAAAPHRLSRSRPARRWCFSPSTSPNRL